MAEELEVIRKAKELAKHTLQITSNANHYPKKFRFSLVDKMQNKSLEIYEMLMEAIRQMAETLKLQLNGKTQIVPFRKGIRFMGFHHYVTKEGKYIRKLSGEKKRRIKRKLRKWSRAVDAGKMPEKKFYEKYQAWRNHALHGNCIKLCRSMDLYVKELREKDGQT